MLPVPINPAPFQASPSLRVRGGRQTFFPFQALHEQSASGQRHFRTLSSHQLKRLLVSSCLLTPFGVCLPCCCLPLASSVFVVLVAYPRDDIPRPKNGEEADSPVQSHAARHCAARCHKAQPQHYNFPFPPPLIFVFFCVSTRAPESP